MVNVFALRDALAKIERFAVEKCDASQPLTTAAYRVSFAQVVDMARAALGVTEATEAEPEPADRLVPPGMVIQVDARGNAAIVQCRC